MFEIFTSLADWAAYGVLRLPPGGQTAEAVHFFIEDTAKIFALLVVIVFIMGLFRSALDPERVRRMIARTPRGVAYGLAAVLGAVTPFCSCSSVPLFIGFLEAGIPLGVTMTFLIVSPMVNEIAVLILASTMGWTLTAVYVGVGIAVGIAGGVLTDRLRLERWVEDYVWTIRMGTAPSLAVDNSLRGRIRFAWGEVREIVGRIWLYVLIGIGVGALLHGYVPQDLFLRYAGADNPLAVPIAVLMGLPLYSNATGVIPIAEALLSKGLPIGTVIAFMMSTVAVSVPEFIILRKVLKPPMLAFFAGFLLIAFTGVGYLLNALFVA
jgi:uncharacterized protein